jgi:hypothetical protein
MSKSQSKQRKKGAGGPAVPPFSVLRPRLDAYWGSPKLLEQDQAAMHAELDAITRGIKPELFLPVIVRARDAAPSAAQVRLDEALPAWIRERGYADVLETLIERDGIGAEHQQRAMDWLAATGSDRDRLAALAEWDPFFHACFTGDDSQAALLLFWYTSRARQRVQGFNLLIDYNPPWDGSIKDNMLYPQRAPRQAITEFVDAWRARMPMPMEELEAAEAKRRIVQALTCNRAANIRLPVDLINVRDLFLRIVLALPDGPETPPFTAEDFDALAQSGERPEKISHYEQTVGRRVRMKDGQEVLVMGSNLDWGDE